MNSQIGQTSLPLSLERNAEQRDKMPHDDPSPSFLPRLCLIPTFFLLYYKLRNRGRTTRDGPLRDANTARFTLEKAAPVFEGRYLTDRYPAEHPAIQDGQEQQQVCGSFQVCLLSPSSFPLQLARTPLSSSSLCF